VADGTCTGDRKRIRFGIAKLASLRRGQCGGMGPTDRKICFQSDGNAGVIGFEESQDETQNRHAAKNLFRNLTK